MTFPDFASPFEYISMSDNYMQVYVHLNWSTWNREPLITERHKPAVYMAILNEARRANAMVHAIGGIEDHVHVLLELPSTITVGNLVKQMKGKSSFLCGIGFKWQHRYGAVSVTRRDVPGVIEYVENQEHRHRIGQLIPSLEKSEPDK